MPCRVSIIVPTLNEATSLGRTLRCLSILEPGAWEIIVVDGGSEDETIAIAQTAAQTLLQAIPVTIIRLGDAGRSRQLQRGAEVATGEVLCFLHADTIVPDDLVQVIEQTLSDETVAAGGFIALMTGTNTTRWSVSLHNFLKTYYAPLLFRPYQFFAKGLRLLFGDQVMFCRRETYQQCGGFDPKVAILEEADLCAKLVRFGRIRQVNRVVQSSDRRVAKWGVLKATGIYLMIGFLWGLGVPSKFLKRFYEDVR
ncbi:MAG: TIGR04283 family arsenosugar biosynthesis glycosyltransferase [Leptolyngbyaceae cyanobacterium bins.349]|nr:TIGR04283 family arsenosugar biosynthesis glycosyltransferase [Leptolyngbyaceae cyanobacterium bins.349]